MRRRLPIAYPKPTRRLWRCERRIQASEAARRVRCVTAAVLGLAAFVGAAGRHRLPARWRHHGLARHLAPSPVDAHSPTVLLCQRLAWPGERPSTGDGGRLPAPARAAMLI